MITVREERPGDVAGIRSVLVSAFDTEAEANLVDAIRESGARQVSFVAEDDGRVVGQILFSEAKIRDTIVAALAPISVAPGQQRTGIGSRLVETGLEACRNARYPAVVVLGHAEYYPRFGFVPARPLGIECPYDVPDEVWMVLELLPGALHDIRGTVEYHEAFADL